MILSIDGNVCCGKTSLFHMICTKIENCHAISEYLPVTGMDLLKVQYRYMDQEIERKNKIYTNASLILLDRSILSILAFVFNIYKMNIRDMRKECFDYFKKLYFEGNILVPDYYILLISDYRSAYKRFEQRVSGAFANKSDNILMNKTYHQNYNTFVKGFFNLIPKDCYIIAEYLKNNNSIIQFINDLLKKETHQNCSDLLMQYTDSLFFG